MKSIVLLSLGLVLSLVSCKKESNFDLITTFSSAENSFDVELNEVFEITAYPKPYGKVESEWYVNGDLIMTGGKFSYAFNEAGVYTLRYVGKYEGRQIEENFDINVANALDVTLSIGDVNQVISEINEMLEISAVIAKGSGVEHEWEIDGVVVSTDVGIRYLLEESKVYKVKYTAKNSAGMWEKEFDVVVESGVIRVNFSIQENSVINTFVNREVEIIATITKGAEGATQEWKINGDIVSTNGILKYIPVIGGEYEISYTAKDSEGIVQKEAVWVLDVDGGNVIVDNFESGIRDIYTYPAAATVEIVDNPSKVGINTSSKVLKITKSFASQQLGVNIFRATNPTVDIREEIRNKDFDRVRFKYFNNNFSSGRKVNWRFNGDGTTFEADIQPTSGQWSEVVIKMTKTQINTINQLFLRLNDGTGALDTHIIYIDDIEFYNSEIVGGI